VLTINPGIYPSIMVSGNGKLTMNPGTYVIAGGAFAVSGNGSVSGSGVFIFNAGSAFPNAGGSFGSFSFSGNTTVNLSAPTSGPYAGVIFFQARDNTRALALSGNASGSSGILYAASAPLVLSDNANLSHLAAVVSTLSLSSGAFQLQDGATSDYVSSTSNQILYATLTVAVQDDTGAGIDPSEMARVNDALSYLNAALGSFGVNLSMADPGTTADVHVHFASSTPSGGASDGVLGFTTAENDVYLVTGWNFYTGADPAQIGAGQYDFLTLATHELSHTVGLGESSDPASVMYEYLSPGTVRRTFTDGNLTAINTDADRFLKVAAAGVGLAPSGSATGLDSGGLVAEAPSHDPLFVQPTAALLNGSDRGSHSLEISVLPLSAAWPVASQQPGGEGVLVGGAGEDLLIGGDGRDLLIGGFGAQRSASNAEADTAIVGTTGPDHKVQAVDAVMKEWASSATDIDNSGALRLTGSLGQEFAADLVFSNGI
jgi:Ca2+-binding RTX toxin-like protein